MQSESFPVFELVASAAPPVKRVPQSSALLSPLCPCTCKEEKTLSCIVGLEETSKTFLDAFSSLYEPGIVEVVGTGYKSLICSQIIACEENFCFL